VHLIGTSYGALTALAFAIEDPSQVRSLVLVEPPVLQWIAGGASGTDVLDDFMRDVWHNARQHFAQDRPQCAMQTLYDGLRGSGAYASLNPRRRAEIMRNAQAMDLLVRSDEPFPYLDKGKAAALDMPILLVSGQQTVPIHQRANAIVATVLPSAERATIPHAGHAPASENPREFNAVVRRFLTSIARCPR
jgi:pimeloyl-ACP methyl ester carboxylesterase